MFYYELRDTTAGTHQCPISLSVELALHTSWKNAISNNRIEIEQILLPSHELRN